MADDPSVPTVFGWDASDYDWARGPMDLAAARADGIDFFTHKATEATWTKHVHYGEAMRRARDAGIPVLGAYHVVRSPADAAREVDYCLAYVDAQTPWWRDWPCWFWQVDLEKWPYDAVPASEGEAFADIIEAKTGRRAIIYASRGQYGEQLTGTSHELWNANYGTNPAMHYRDVYAARGGDTGPGWASYSGRVPVFWQFGSRTTIGGQGICDANAFRGTVDQLKAMIKGDDDMTPEQERLLRNAETYAWKESAGEDPITGILDNSGNPIRPGMPNMPMRTAKAALVAAEKALAAVNELAARPPVVAAPLDPAVLKAVLLDPEVLAGIAEAVADEDHRRSAE